MDDVQYRSNGKLMISGEYLVLAGASALAIPVVYGQTLAVNILPEQQPAVSWLAKEHGKTWFEAEFILDHLFDKDDQSAFFQPAQQQGVHAGNDLLAHQGQGTPLPGPDTGGHHGEHARISLTLKKILTEAKTLHPGFLSGNYRWIVTTELDFDRQWGLGSSSTLISNIAWWAGVDPFVLLFNTLGGSGYDVACARSLTPLIYKYKGARSMPESEQVPFQPAFSDHLFFIFTGKKQSSAKSLQGFDAGKVKSTFVNRVTQITESMHHAKSLSMFMELMFEHEHIISQAIDQMPVQLEHYPDFDGAVKSLGAWGGDFIMAASNRDKEYVVKYFEAKGLQVVIPFNEMVLQT